MNKFFKSFKENLVFNILVVIISFGVSFYAIGLKVEPKENQKFRIMINDYNINLNDIDYKFSDNILKYETVSVNNSEISTLIAAQKDTLDYDLLIVNKTVFDEKDFSYSLLPLDVTQLDALLPAHSKEYIEKENQIFGFKITEQIKKYSQADLTGEYFVSFFLNSTHSGSLNSCESNESINFINWLLN